MITSYKKNLSIQFLHYLQVFFQTFFIIRGIVILIMHQCKITTVYNNTILWYDIVPILNKSIVHIRTRLKWSVTILDNIKMIKMCSSVRGKVQLTRIYSQCVHTSDLIFLNVLNFFIYYLLPLIIEYTVEYERFIFF